MHRLRALAPFLIAAALVALPAAASADTSFAQLLSQYEQEYHLPTGILGKIAIAESGGKSTVCASSSSACGMFQFIDSTWLQDTKSMYGQPLSLSLRNNPSIAARAAAYELGTIQTKIGGLITQANVNLSAGLYLGYFLGAGGAQTLLTAYIQNPAQSSCALLPRQCASNQSIMANRSVSQLISWAAAKMSVPGVPSVAGNFQCSNGVSYAYSYCDVNPSNFLPANTVIPANPYGQYATVFPTTTSAPTGTTGLTGLPVTAIPQTSQTTATQPTGSTVTTATSGSACTPQYYCSNNTVYYKSDSCSTSIFQQCQYGCQGTICAPAPSASTSGSLTLNPQTAGGVLSAGASTAGSGASTLFNSSLLDSSIATIIQGNAPEASAPQPAFAQADENPLYGNVTLTQTYDGTTYAAVPSPFSQVLNQLKNVLTGLLSYLGSL